MFKCFLADERGGSAVEYIVVAVLAVGILGTIIWGLMDTVAGKGQETADSIEAINVP